MGKQEQIKATGLPESLGGRKCDASFNCQMLRRLFPYLRGGELPWWAKRTEFDGVRRCRIDRKDGK